MSPARLAEQAWLLVRYLSIYLARLRMLHRSDVCMRARACAVAACCATCLLRAPDSSALHVQVTEDQSQARVVYVAQRGPAERAGLAVGDTVLSLNGQPVSLADKRCACHAGAGPAQALCAR